MLPYTREIISFFSIEIKAETEYNILVAKMFGLIIVRSTQTQLGSHRYDENNFEANQLFRLVE